MISIFIIFLSVFWVSDTSLIPIDNKSTVFFYFKLNFGQKIMFIFSKY
jgi:hypothetical protein